MTDITELALRLKLEAHRAVSNFNPQMNIKTRDLKELVEALEKAQQERDNWRTTFDNERFRADKLKAHIDEMTEERNASINELSRIIQKEVKAKRETEQRIAELESRTVTAAAADVLAERKRQVTTEGWTPEHDDQHVNFEMAIAGGLYAISAVDSHHKLRNSAPSAWPWDRKWWKPDGPRRDLVKAGALILAEIERLDRAAGIKVEAE